MRLARINDGFKLRIGQQAVGDDVRRKVRPIGRDSAAPPTPSRLIGPAWWDVAESREYGSIEVHILRKAPR